MFWSVLRSSVVLLVDDDPVGLFATGDLLVRRGYRVLRADSAEQALGMAEPAQPDLVIADLRLPQMNGLELIEALGRRPRLTRMKSLLVSTADETEVRRHVIRHAHKGAVLLRPTPPEHFLTVVAGLCPAAQPPGAG